jgi:teichuronic acid biosynthesis glycosyltransferase TuaC
MDRQIRVLIVTSEWPSAEHPYRAPYLVRHVDFLRRAGIDVEVFAFSGERRPMNYVRARKHLQQRLKERRYDLVHAHFGQSALLPWPRRLPLVVTFHGCDIQGVKRPDGRMSWGGAFLQKLSQLVALRAEAVILVSERMRGFIPSSVYAPVIPMGIDFEQFPNISREEARAQLGLPQSGKLVLFVGNPADPVKRHPLARRAVEVLNERYPARLVVGWGVLPPQVLVMMRACNVLVMTSQQEGSPLVVKEALASDLPVVSLNVGDVPVRLDGVEGCEICADEKPETIAASLERVLRRDRPLRGRDAVLDLDESRLAAQVVGIYRSVLAVAAQRKAVHGRPLPAQVE